MTVVVLDIPGLWHHPIKPVEHTIPETSSGKLESIPAVLVRMALVISAVTSIEKANELKLASHTIITTSGSKDLRVMSNHCPASEGERRQGQDGDDVHTKSHGELTYYSTGITPHDHLIKMLYISRALILLQPSPSFFISAVKA